MSFITLEDIDENKIEQIYNLLSGETVDIKYINLEKEEKDKFKKILDDIGSALPNNIELRLWVCRSFEVINDEKLQYKDKPLMTPNIRITCITKDMTHREFNSNPDNEKIGDLIEELCKKNNYTYLRLEENSPYAGEVAKIRNKFILFKDERIYR